MAEQVSAAHDSESEEFLDESPFRSSLRTVLLVDLAALSVWTAWVHPGFNGLSRLALVGVWSVPALWSLATRPLLRTLALRRMRRRSRESLFVVTCVLVVTALLTLSTTLADSIGRSARSAVDRRFGSIDEMVLAATPEARLDAQNRLDQTLNARSDTVNDLSLLVQGQLGFVVAEMVLRNEDRTDARAIERNVHVLEMDVAAAARFGTDPALSGLLGMKNPGPDRILLGPHAASALNVRVGDKVTLVGPSGDERPFQVEAVLPEQGLGVVPFDGGDLSRIAIVRPGTITTQTSPPRLRYVIAVSNRDGSKSSSAVTERLEQTFAGADASETPDGQPRLAVAVSVDNVKAQILQQAVSRTEPLSRLLRTLALLFGAGSGLLLISLFFGLASARTPEVGALRSVGMRRGDAVSAFGLEGWFYSIFGAVVGAALGSGGAALILHQSKPRDRALTIADGAQLRTLWIGLSCGFVLSTAALAGSMLIATRGNVNRALGVDRDGKVHPVPRVVVAVLSALSISGCVLILRSFQGRNSFSLLVGLLLLLSALTQLLRLTSIGRRILVPARAVKLPQLMWCVLALSSLALPRFLPTWFRHTGLGTWVSYPLCVLLLGTAAVRAVRPGLALPRFVLPLRRPSTAGGRRAAKTLANAAPGVAPNRDALLVAATSTLVMTLTVAGFLHVGLGRVLSGQGNTRRGWEYVVETADPASIPAVVRSLGISGVGSQVASLDVEVRSAGGFSSRTKALGVGSEFTFRTPMGLVKRANGYSDDAAVFRALVERTGTAVVDQSIFVDGSTHLRRVNVGEAVFVRDLASGRTLTLTVIGVARSTLGLGGVVLGVGTAESLQGSEVGVDRVLVSAADAESADDRLVVAQALDRPDVLVRSIDDVSRSATFETRSVRRSVGWLMVVGTLLVVGAFSVVLVNGVSGRRREWAVLRAVGMSADQIRRVAVSESLQLLAPAAVLGWLVGAIVSSHLVWAGSLGVNAGFSISAFSLAGAVSVVLIPLYAVNRHLRRSTTHDAPLQRV